MKKIILVLTVLFSSSVFSMDKNCPILLESIDTCAQVMWTDGPFLNERGQRKFSTAHVKFFQNGDAEKKPVIIENVQVYPWMIMPMMEHGTRPVTQKLMADNTYMVSKILLKKMHGHWEMRFKLGTDSDPKTDFIGKTKINIGGGHH